VKGESYQFPRHLQIYYPTIWLDGELLVNNGYPTFLLEPQLRQTSVLLGVSSLLQIACAEYLPVLLPEPRTPDLPKVSGSSDLEQAAKVCLRDWVFLKPEDRVLILTDDSVPSPIPQAFEQAARAVGPRELNQFSLESPRATEFSEFVQQVGAQKLPSEVWKQIEEADVIVSPAFLLHLDLSRDGLSFSQWLSEHHKRFVHVVAVPELLASSWALYPPALLEEFGRRAQSAFQDAKALIVASQTAEVVVNFGEPKPSFSVAGLPLEDSFGSIVFPPSPRFRIPLGPGASALGEMVTRRFSAEPIEAVSFDLLVNRIRGMTEAFVERFLPDQAASEPQELVEISFGLSPHAAPAKSDWNGFSPTLWNRFAEFQRSGVVHFVTSHWPTALRSDPWFPWGFELFYPSVNVNGTQVVVELGHLKSLDEPALRTLASEFGDPEQLLTEQWIPALGHTQ